MRAFNNANSAQQEAAEVVEERSAFDDTIEE